MRLSLRIITLLLLTGLFQSGYAATPPKGILQLKPYPAPAIKLTDIDGAAYTLSADRGHWVFVHFWASWCGPCRKEMPEIQQMWGKLQNEGLKIAMINVAENEDTVFSFLASHAPDIRALMDRDGLTAEQWRPRGLPATYLVSPDGKVHYQALGGRPWHQPEYMTFIRRLLSKK